MAKKKPDQMARFRKDVEVIVADLRKRAAHAAAQAEKYIHSLRKELEKPAVVKKAKKAVKKSARSVRKMAPALE